MQTHHAKSFASPKIRRENVLNEWAAVLPVSVWELKTAQKIFDGHLKLRMEGVNDSKGVCTSFCQLTLFFFASAVLIPIVFLSSLLCMVP